MFTPRVETKSGRARPFGREGRLSMGSLPHGLGVGMMCGALMLLLATRSSAQPIDSATSACRQHPALCLRTVGEEPGVAGSVHAVAGPGASVGSVGMLLGAQLKTLVERALVECADQARSQVLMERMQGRSPSEQECNQQVPGTSLTLAMLLGQEMHREAARCAGDRLARLTPGNFSLEPRYRYEPGTGRTEFISEEQAQLLLRQGRGSELKGTLRPDVVIHLGDPLQVQAIYDFKFGCTGLNPADWTKYGEGHLYRGLNQKGLYGKALHKNALRVVPRMGIME